MVRGACRSCQQGVDDVSLGVGQRAGLLRCLLWAWGCATASFDLGDALTGPVRVAKGAGLLGMTD